MPILCGNAVRLNAGLQRAAQGHSYPEQAFFVIPTLSLRRGGICFHFRLENVRWLKSYRLGNAAHTRYNCANGRARTRTAPRTLRAANGHGGRRWVDWYGTAAGVGL